MLIILTGPPGAGKSTIAHLLALTYEKSATFSIDTIREFIVGGNFAPWDPSPESRKQHKLSEEIAGMVIKKYIDNNYVVILDGIYNGRDVLKYKKKFKDVYGFVLLPSLKINRARDRGREKHKQVPKRVKVLHDHYSTSVLKQFEVIDSTEQTPKQTVKLIKSKIINK